jgi:TonB family protein
MKSLIKISYLLTLTLTIQLFISCSENNGIEIIQTDDPEYIPFDSVETLSPEKDYIAKLTSDFLGDLYSLSSRGRVEFNYEIYLNESGKCKKIKIVKGLGESANHELFNSIAKNNFRIGIKNNKAVKYKTTLNNKWIFGYERDFSTEKKIEIIESDDPDYIYVDPFYEPEYLKDYVFNSYPITAKIIRYNQAKILDTFDDGSHTFFYRLFINENGKIDKIKIINGMTDELDEILISELPLVKVKIIRKDDVPIKYTVIWSLLFRIEDNSRITVTTDHMIFNKIDESILVNLENRDIEIVNDIDTNYVGVGWLDQYSAYQQLNLIMMFDLYDQCKSLLSSLSKGEYRYDYLLHINELGLVDKVKIEKGMGEQYDALLIDDLSTAIFYQGRVDGEPAKYRGQWSFKFRLDENKNISWQGFTLLDSRLPKSISDLPKHYEEKEFFVLPTVLPHPIGGVNSIAEKVIYPDIAKRNGIQGRVLIKTYVNENGDVIGVQTLGGIGYNCEEAAIKAIKETRFEPGYSEGKPVKSYLVIPVEFSLEEEGVRIKKADLPIPYQETFGDEFIKDSDFLLEADITPFPVGGLKAIQNKILYPTEAKEAKIQGKIFINAFVNFKGDVVKAQVIRGIGGGCDEAAVNAVKQTKFSPGFKNGQPVNVQITVPILFKLN